MSIAEQKVELSRRLLETNDKKLLSRIENILNEELATTWVELPQEIKSDFKQSVAELDAGKFISSEEVLSQARKGWNTKLSGRQKQSRTTSK